MARSIRNTPFCWQEKDINRFLQKTYDNKPSEKMKMKLLYATITELESNFNGADIKAYTITIHKMSGISKEFIPTGLKRLEKLGIIEITEERDPVTKRFLNKVIRFTPENIQKQTLVVYEEESDQEKAINGKAVNGSSINGKPYTLEDSILLEDSIIEEKNNNISNDILLQKEPDLEKSVSSTGLESIFSEDQSMLKEFYKELSDGEKQVLIKQAMPKKLFPSIIQIWKEYVEKIRKCKLNKNTLLTIVKLFRDHGYDLERILKTIDNVTKTQWYFEKASTEWTPDIFFRNGTGQFDKKELLVPNITQSNTIEQLKKKHGHFPDLEFRVLSVWMKKNYPGRHFNTLSKEEQAEFSNLYTNNKLDAYYFENINTSLV